jgi:dynein intermediate chain 2
LIRQNEVAISHKVSDSPLTCIKLNNITGASQTGIVHEGMGKLAAIGDMDGTITLLELSPNLYEPQPKEKEIINEIFEREKKKEEIIKKQRLENSARINMLIKEKNSNAMKNNFIEENEKKLNSLETNFFNSVKNQFESLNINDSSSEEDQENKLNYQQENSHLKLKEYLKKED